MARCADVRGQLRIESTSKADYAGSELTPHGIMQAALQQNQARSALRMPGRYWSLLRRLFSRALCFVDLTGQHAFGAPACRDLDVRSQRSATSDRGRKIRKPLATGEAVMKELVMLDRRPGFSQQHGWWPGENWGGCVVPTRMKHGRGLLGSFSLPGAG